MCSVTLHMFRQISLLSISTVLLTIMTSSHLHECRFVDSAMLRTLLCNLLLCIPWCLPSLLDFLNSCCGCFRCSSLQEFSLFCIHTIFSCFNIQCFCVFCWSGSNCFWTGVYFLSALLVQLPVVSVVFLVHPVASSSSYLATSCGEVYSLMVEPSELGRKWPPSWMILACAVHVP